jgi:hypothetical protein
MTRNDALKILELAANHTLAQLKTSYREALLVWHPDRFAAGTTLLQKATLKTQQINEAYRLLICSPRTITERFEPRSAPADEPSAKKAKPKAKPPSIPRSNPVPSSQASRGKHSYMVGDDDLFCYRCGEVHFGNCKNTFLGLKRFKCSACGHENEFPPSTNYLGCCWLILGVSVTIMAVVFSSGGFAYPGFLAIVALLSIASGYSAKSRVRRALQYHRTRQSGR